MRCAPARRFAERVAPLIVAYEVEHVASIQSVEMMIYSYELDRITCSTELKLIHEIGGDVLVTCRVSGK